MSKYITDELIDDKMSQKGWEYTEEYTEQCDKVLEHFEVELVSEWQNGCDYFIYSETTYDGYDVWVTTYDDSGPKCIYDEVHYYDNDLGDKLKEAMQDYGVCKIHLQGWDDDEWWIQDVIQELYQELWEEFQNEAVNELKDEGYDYEEDAE